MTHVGALQLRENWQAEETHNCSEGNRNLDNPPDHLDQPLPQIPTESLCKREIKLLIDKRQLSILVPAVRWWPEPTCFQRVSQIMRTNNSIRFMIIYQRLLQWREASTGVMWCFLIPVRTVAAACRISWRRLRELCGHPDNNELQ